MKYANGNVPLEFSFAKLFGNDHPKSVLSRDLFKIERDCGDDIDWSETAELCEALFEARAEAECCGKLLEQCVKDSYSNTMKRLV
jgi:hypothetical protein